MEEKKIIENGRKAKARKFRANRSKSIDLSMTAPKGQSPPFGLKAQPVAVTNPTSQENLVVRNKTKFLNKFKDMMTEEELQIYK